MKKTAVYLWKSGIVIFALKEGHFKLHPQSLYLGLKFQIHFNEFQVPIKVLSIVFMHVFLW